MRQVALMFLFICLSLSRLYALDVEEIKENPPKQHPEEVFPIQHLSPEILDHVFSFLDTPSTLSAARTCWQWHNIIWTDVYWQRKNPDGIFNFNALEKKDNAVVLPFLQPYPRVYWKSIKLLNFANCYSENLISVLDVLVASCHNRNPDGPIRLILDLNQIGKRRMDYLAQFLSNLGKIDYLSLRGNCIDDTILATFLAELRNVDIRVLDLGGNLIKDFQDPTLRRRIQDYYASIDHAVPHILRINTQFQLTSRQAAHGTDEWQIVSRKNKVRIKNQRCRYFDYATLEWLKGQNVKVE